MFFQKFVVSVLLCSLAGCVATQQRSMKIGSKEATERMRAVKAGEFDSLINAYDISHGIQKDDSIYINNDDLNAVAKMAFCPKREDEVGFFSYSAKAYIDRTESVVKIKINRPDCSVDRTWVKVHLDARIEENKRRSAKRVQQEIQAEQVNPQRPYRAGCDAYQRYIKGYSDFQTAENAVKSYPKMNADYVRRLFATGWNDASYYGVRSVDCGYLTQINIR